jgi:hypothetical protein
MMKSSLLALAVGTAAALTAVPAAASTTVAWNPTTDTGYPTDFDTASQGFAGVTADTISFTGSGYFHNHGGTQGFNIYAIVNGVTQTIYSYPTGTPTDYYYLSNLGAISFSGGLVTGISIGSTSAVGQGFHGFGDEAFALSMTGSVPEPGTWAMMLLGFGAIGLSMRARRSGQKLQQTA